MKALELAQILIAHPQSEVYFTSDQLGDTLYGIEVDYIGLAIHLKAPGVDGLIENEYVQNDEKGCDPELL